MARKRWLSSTVRIATQLNLKRPLHLPALFLAKGMALVCGEVEQIRSAQGCFEKAMALAGQQSALSFELRGRDWNSRDSGLIEVKCRGPMISLDPFTVDLPKVSQRPISFWRDESSNRRAFGRGKPGEGWRIHQAERRKLELICPLAITGTQAVHTNRASAYCRPEVSCKSRLFQRSTTETREA